MRQAEVPEAYTWDRGNMLISIRCVRGFAQLIPSVVSRRQRPPFPRSRTFKRGAKPQAPPPSPPRAVRVCAQCPDWSGVPTQVSTH